MMPTGKLAKMVAANAFRSKSRFALSTFGVVAGIAAFVFFLALSMGVRNLVVGKIFPLERLEVIAPRASLAGLDLTKKLDDGIVDKIRARPEVVEAVPRMALSFPARGSGWFDGKELNFEAGGFADGVATTFLSDESYAEYFQDWETDAEKAKQAACGPAPKYACETPSRYYCDQTDMKCHHRVPVVVSRHLLAIYNTQFASSHGLPVIGSDLAKFIVERGGMGKMKVYLHLGDTMVPGSNKKIADRQRTVQGVLLGLSDKAMKLGMTVPIDYIRRWNREYAGEVAANTYSSIVVTVHESGDVASFSAWLQNDLDLRLEDSWGERFSQAILIVTLLFVAISLIIIIISAINIGHNFLVQIIERRKEIGLLRAVGATRADITALVLGEAAFVGLVGGTVGIAVARGIAAVVNLVAKAYLPNFSFNPDSYFDFRWWIVVGALAYSVFFCILGGILPARRAAKMPPAVALAER